jgi:hypothetical protein
MKLSVRRLCCAFSKLARYVMPDPVAIYYRRHPGNMTRASGVALHQRWRAIDKSMGRRKVDPSLHTVEVFSISRAPQTGSSCKHVGQGNMIAGEAAGDRVTMARLLIQGDA